MRHAAALACCCLAVAACGRDNKPNETAASPQIDTAVAAMTGDTVRDTTRAVGDTTGVHTAVAAVTDSAGRALGSVTLTDTAGGIRVDGEITGLAVGNHGLHIHGVGRCDRPAFTSAGEHWNPTNKQHGLGNPNGPHQGDLPNLTVAQGGVGQVHYTTRGGTLRALLDADGAALVVHDSADDQQSQPSGKSGPRIACGVIHRK